MAPKTKTTKKINTDLPKVTPQKPTQKGFKFETPYDTYIVEEVIGEGANGIVLKVRNLAGDSLALKYLKPAVAKSKKLKRFKNEISFCQKNEHPNILRVLDEGYQIIDDIKCPFYISKLYDGTLKKMIGKITPEKVLPYFSQILDGIEAAHKKNTFHRDLKPENILYDYTSNKMVIGDFGIAHIAEEFLATSVETIQGDRLANAHYAAPEQRDPNGRVDLRADIYALGLILNEMFTSATPHGSNFKKIADISSPNEYLDEIVDHMISQNQANRPKSIEEIKQRLIARQNNFITLQKIHELEKTIVPASTVDDPLVVDPVRIIGFDYQNDTVICKLSASPNRTWEEQWLNSGGMYTTSMHWNMVSFSGNFAHMRASESRAQEVVNFIKGRIQVINENYRVFITEKKRQEDERKRQDLITKLEAEKKRAELIKKIQF